MKFQPSTNHQLPYPLAHYGTKWNDISLSNYPTGQKQQQTTKESNPIHIQKPTITKAAIEREKWELVQTSEREQARPKVKEGSRDQNREWEVGHNSRYNDIDDEPFPFDSILIPFLVL